MKVKDDVASFWAMSKHVQASHHCGNRRGNANSKQTTISFDSENGSIKKFSEALFYWQC